MPEFREMINREGQDGLRLLFADMGQLKSLALNPLPNVYEDGNGNIGIGTISPSTLLHLRAVIPTVYAQVAPSVADTVLVVANVQTTESTDDQAQILFNVNGGTQNRMASIGLIAENSATRLGALVFTTDDGAARTEKLRISGAGEVLVGETTPIASFNGTTIFQVSSEATNGTMLVHREAANVSGPTVELLKRRSVWTVVQSGDQLGSVEFQGADGVDAALGARIRATVDGTPGSNDLPTRLDFDTTPDGSGAPTTRMSVTPSGDVGIGTITPGVPLHVLESDVTSPAWAAADLLVLERSGTLRLHLHNGPTDTAGIWFTDTVRGRGRLDYNHNTDTMSLYTTSLQRVIIDSGGNVGIGTAAPQGQLHTYDAISGFLLWEFNGLDATVRTIIPNGSGDVLYRLHADFVLRDSAAAVASGSTDVSNGASVNLTVGGNTVRLRVNADGSTDIARTAGTDTIRVALTLRWL